MHSPLPTSRPGASLPRPVFRRLAAPPAARAGMGWPWSAYFAFGVLVLGAAARRAAGHRQLSRRHRAGAFPGAHLAGQYSRHRCQLAGHVAEPAHPRPGDPRRARASGTGFRRGGGRPGLGHALAFPAALRAAGNQRAQPGSAARRPGPAVCRRPGDQGGRRAGRRSFRLAAGAGPRRHSQRDHHLARRTAPGAAPGAGTAQLRPAQQRQPSPLRPDRGTAPRIDRPAGYSRRLPGPRPRCAGGLERRRLRRARLCRSGRLAGLGRLPGRPAARQRRPAAVAEFCQPGADRGNRRRAPRRRGRAPGAGTAHARNEPRRRAPGRATPRRRLRGWRPGIWRC